MAVERGGRFQWDEDQIFGGIRQDITDSPRHYRYLVNCSVIDSGSLIKDKGCRKLINAQLSGGGDTFGGFHATYSGAGHKLFLFQDNGSSACVVYRFDPSGGGAHDPAVASWVTTGPTEQTLARVKPFVTMFRNKMITADGTLLRARDSSGTWTTPANGLSSTALKNALNACKFGAVYNNRLILCGNPSLPNQFYVSDPLDEAVWDASNIVDITETGGEEVLGMGVVGSHLLVGGDNFLRAYFLGNANAQDWDNDLISGQVGPVNWQSFVSADRWAGNESASSYTFFWTKRGPAMCAGGGSNLPSLVPLWEPLRRACLGENYRGFTGFDVSEYSNIEGVWCPEFNEVRWTLCSTAAVDSKRNIILCLDFDSALDYARGVRGAYPIFRIKENKEFTDGYPVSTLFSVEVDGNGAPTRSGVQRTFSAKDGLVYELDSLNSAKDLGTHVIKMQARMDGYDGQEDGASAHEKSLRGLQVQVTAEGTYDLQCRVISDGGVDTSSNSINIGEGRNLWGGGEDWGTETLWNSGEFNLADIDLHALGRSFDLEFFDEGAIEGPVQINYWSLWGYLEDRR